MGLIDLPSYEELRLEVNRLQNRVIKAEEDRLKSSLLNMQYDYIKLQAKTKELEKALTEI